MHINKHIAAGYAGKDSSRRIGMPTLSPQTDGVIGNGMRALQRIVYKYNHCHKQRKIDPMHRYNNARKKKFRQWLRKHDMPITKWNYIGGVLPVAA